jgi:hypothetical protein
LPADDVRSLVVLTYVPSAALVTSTLTVHIATTAPRCN